MPTPSKPRQQVQGSDVLPPVSTRQQFMLPFRKLWPILGGVAVGLLLRLVFSGNADGPYSAMMGAFIYLSPLLVGMVTVYLAERQQRRGWAYYLVAPFFANVLYIAGTLLIMIEGWICAIVIVPMFALLGALGGLLMGLVCRMTNWPQPTLHCVAILPLMLGALEHRIALPDALGVIERRITIEAPAVEVWQHLMDADHIEPMEVDRAWMYRIGVPLPLAGVTRETATGLVRDVKMGKGIHFQQVATDWQPMRRVRWQYRFNQDSIPPGALDDHVRIGGRYFDLLDTTYTLTPGGPKTELQIQMRYRVSTRFNWYADSVAKWLVGDFEDVILEFYRQRSEAFASQRKPGKQNTAEIELLAR